MQKDVIKSDPLVDDEEMRSVGVSVSVSRRRNDPGAEE